MQDGKGHITRGRRCVLCGLETGALVECSMAECTKGGCITVDNGDRGLQRANFHVTCAKPAGLHVALNVGRHIFEPSVKCWAHGDCKFVFRARLEDLIEIERDRCSPDEAFNDAMPMTWDHASYLFHTAVDVMKTLGWAWRWAEWWVEFGDKWEPLIEEWQNEMDMTEEDLKIVKSTPLSRCEDARTSRLAAFGAALRNRDYDRDSGDDREPLERALTAIVSTRSLAGVWNEKEVTVLVTLLALAYRSKSPMLGFGLDKAAVTTDRFCVHQEDDSPKYKLGTRSLPGKTKPHSKSVFEPRVNEVLR